MKILLVDIETSPNTGHIWGLFKQNISVKQLLESSYTMCWAAKWLGDDDVYFDSVHRNTSKQMLKTIHSMMCEADAVVHWNGTRFDIPTLNKEFLLHNMTPPSPVKEMDLLRVSRQRFRFPSNRLDYIAQTLGLGDKTQHEGHELWIKCMAGNKDAWSRMEEYNINDVVLLERVYERFLPWIKSHANHSLHSGDVCCPNCGNDSFQRRGLYHTLAATYQRYRCNACGNWFKSGTSLAKKPANKAMNIS